MRKLDHTLINHVLCHLTLLEGAVATECEVSYYVFTIHCGLKYDIADNIARIVQCIS